MNVARSFVLSAGALAAAVAVSLNFSAAPAADSGSAASASIARGAYLTGPAGQCADCHREGLGGGPNLIPGPPGAPWAKNVPSLRGLPMFKSDADAIAFLRTAKLPDGTSALGPMPHYNFDEADATAIVAYLRSLK